MIQVLFLSGIVLTVIFIVTIGTLVTKCIEVKKSILLGDELKALNGCAFNVIVVERHI